jgi:hypothetical protein
MGKLQDKVAIVTGAASGLGKGIATRFAAERRRLASRILLPRPPRPPRRSSGQPAIGRWRMYQNESGRSWSTTLSTCTACSSTLISIAGSLPKEPYNEGVY